MTTDEMLNEIASYKYKSGGFPCVFLSYSHFFKTWCIIWRNPTDFINNGKTDAKTPNESCKKALDFIKNNPQIFKK